MIACFRLLTFSGGFRQMKYEKSCGAVILRRENNQCFTLLIQNKNGGHWAFPKGHTEGNETERETAMREVLEETGLDICIHTDFRFVIQYSPMPEVMKDVVYFLAEVSSAEVHCQEEEIEAACWLPLDEAEAKVTFPQDKSVMRAAAEYTKKHLL